MGNRAGTAPGRRFRFRPHAGFIAVNALFAAIFVALVLSAFHAPSPHGLPVGIVAPASVTGQVEDALGGADPGGFDLRVYPSEAAARTAIAQQQVDGALIDSSGGLRLLVAQAAGTAPAQTLTTAFSKVAAKSGQALTVTDVVPPGPDDTMALSPFFVILGVLIPSVAAGSASALVFRRSRPAWCVAAPVAAAIGIGAVAAGIADGVAGLGNYWAIAAIATLFSLAVAAPTAAFGRIWPPLVAVAVLAFIVVGIPASGGPGGLGAFGPGFLRVLHPALPLGAAASAVRGAVYFGGYGVAGPLWTLAAWAIGGMAALALVVTRRRAPAAVPVHAAGTAALAEAPVFSNEGTFSSAGAFANGQASWNGQGQVPPTDIIAGFDNSGPARRALGQAARLAAARHGTLHIVYSDHVLVESDLSGFGHAEMEAARDQEAAAVAAAATEIAAEAGVPYTFERRQDAPADAILAAASELAAADEGSPVVVVGRSGHAARHLLGSVPTHLLHHSPYPVLTIP
jgi:nucleotide-binding universal stress UspA family protein